MKVALIGTQATSLLGFRRDLILQLVADGHQVYGFATDFNEQSRKALQRLGALPKDYTLNRSGLNPLQDLRDTFRLARQFRTLEPDRVLTYFAKPVVFASLAARWAGVPVVIAMLEGLGFAFTKQPHPPTIKARLLKQVQLMLYRRVLPNVNRVIFLNPDDAQELTVQHRILVKAHSVLGGIGLDLRHYRFQPAATNPVRFIFVGRLLREKGIHEFIQAAQDVKAGHPDAEFQVIGDTDPDNPGSLTEHSIAQLRQEGTVDFKGYVDDIRPLLAQASVFVLPSYREGFPRSTQEAMAAGLPVITTCVPGCRETVQDGVNGFLVPPWDSQSLAKRMRYFLENPAAIAQMGQQSYRYASQHFDSVKTNRKLISLLEL